MVADAVLEEVHHHLPALRDGLRLDDGLAGHQDLTVRARRLESLPFRRIERPEKSPVDQARGKRDERADTGNDDERETQVAGPGAEKSDEDAKRGKASASRHPRQRAEEGGGEDERRQTEEDEALGNAVAVRLEGGQLA